MPRPEDTLEQLGQLAREDEARQSALERRWTRDSDVPEPALEGLPEELAQPLSAARQRAIADLVSARVANKPSPQELTERQAAAPKSTRTEAIWGSRHAWRVVPLAVAAMAAAFFLWVRGPSDSTDPLARYEATWLGDQSHERSVERSRDVLRLLPNSTLRFELRPQSDVSGSVATRSFLIPAGASPAQARELPTVQEQSEFGALRLRLSLPQDLAESGSLVLLIGRTAAIERGLPELYAHSEPASAGLVQKFHWAFVRSK